MSSTTKIRRGGTYAYDVSSNRTQIQPLGYTAVNDLQRYGYDGLNRLTSSIRGPEDGLKEQEAWRLDATGNWQKYDLTAVDEPSKNLSQQRSANPANEITDITRSYGANWPTPTYDRAGNTTNFPAPLDPAQAMNAVYDAWNRLVETDDGTTTVSYAYDVTNRRTTLTTGGTVRHFYYSSSWQILEERLDAATTADRQFLWGLRYIDDQIFRDVSGTRLYGLQDANWNLVAIVNASGTVQQRYRYLAYGQPIRLNADGSIATGSDTIEWEFLFCGYRYDRVTGLYDVRFRPLHSLLGLWLTRDPLLHNFATPFYLYVDGNPSSRTDQFGLQKTGSTDLSNGRLEPFSSSTNIVTYKLVPTGIGTALPSHTIVFPDVRPIYVNTANACGSAGFNVPDIAIITGSAVDFTECCNNHDYCYGTCITQPRALSKSDCDLALYNCMISRCNNLTTLGWGWTLSHLLCNLQAYVYYHALSIGGHGTYEDAQKQACGCTQ